MWIPVILSKVVAYRVIASDEGEVAIEGVIILDVCVTLWIYGRCSARELCIDLVKEFLIRDVVVGAEHPADVACGHAYTHSLCTLTIPFCNRYDLNLVLRKVL